MTPRLLLSLLCVVVVGVAAQGTLVRRNGCSFSPAAEDGDDCVSMAEAWGIEKEQFVRFNPGVNCGILLQVGREYCVEWAAVATPLPSSAAASPAVQGQGESGGGNDGASSLSSSFSNAQAPAPAQQGASVPELTQPGITPSCVRYHDVQSGEDCYAIKAKYHHVFSLEQFYAWNPAVGKDCRALWAGYRVCIGLQGTPSLHTQPPNGIETPFPTQPQIADNCNGFYEVKVGEGCAAIAAAKGITVDQFRHWNPSVGKTCTGLWAKANACVSVVGHEPSATKPRNGITTPQPTQAGMVDNCKEFYEVQPGDNCWEISRRHGIDMLKFIEWNHGVGVGCNALMAYAHACVRVL